MKYVSYLISKTIFKSRSKVERCNVPRFEQIVGAGLGLWGVRLGNLSTVCLDAVDLFWLVRGEEQHWGQQLAVMGGPEGLRPVQVWDWRAEANFERSPQRSGAGECASNAFRGLSVHGNGNVHNLLYDSRVAVMLLLQQL
ncbi:jg1135 [Pararge aegeria aegeria]|uniref:Jg1135 protein n=1 Tax=Pararge aegeria aegeria TaxID=348720 RepID=A0A8S4S2W7_9NEOP|nr:jg1135 [Pararge aegeria aegeria]